MTSLRPDGNCRICGDYTQSQSFSFKGICMACENGNMEASDKQIGGSHYKDFKIQPFEFFVKNNIPFHKADIIKRILRYDLPTGKGKEDLEKIKHEIDLILEWSDIDA